MKGGGRTLPQSDYKKDLAAMLRKSVREDHDKIAEQITEAVGNIAYQVGMFVEFRKTKLTYPAEEMRKEVRRYARMILNWAEKLKNAPSNVRDELTSTTFYDEDADAACKIGDYPKDEYADSIPDPTNTINNYSMPLIQTLLERYGNRLLAYSMTKARRPKLNDEEALLEITMLEWERVTGRVADGTKKKAGALARDGFPAFRGAADIIQSHINTGPGKEHGFKITDLNLNTVIDKILKDRRAQTRAKLTHPPQQSRKKK